MARSAARCGSDGCDLPAVKDSTSCILHDYCADKDVTAFLKALETRDFDGYLDYREIVFPVAFPIDHFFDRTIAGLNLEDATFHSEFRLSNTTFVSPVSLFGANFNKAVTITHTVFEDELNFGAGLETLLLQTSVFKGDVFFAYLVALKGFYLESSQFEQWADFTEVDFSQVAVLYDLTFCGESNFRGALFRDARFHKVQFKENVSFRSSVVRERLTLDDCAFEKALDFRSVEQRSDACITFRGANLEKALVTSTDLRRVNLEDIRWREASTARSRRRALVEEFTDVHFEGQVFDAGFYEFNAATAGQVEVAYRQLKHMSDDGADHELAGEFHIGEMEMKRRQLSWSRVDRYPLEAYRIVSLYGERWLRPLLLLVALVLLVAVANLFFGITIAGTRIDYGLRGTFDAGALALDLGRCIIYAVESVTLRRPQDVKLTDASRAVSVAGSIAGPVLIALLVLALRERLKR